MLVKHQHANRDEVGRDFHQYFPEELVVVLPRCRGLTARPCPGAAPGGRAPRSQSGLCGSAGRSAGGTPGSSGLPGNQTHKHTHTHTHKKGSDNRFRVNRVKVETFTNSKGIPPR